MGWQAVGFDDRGWKAIHVPAFWETQGLRGYDGYGWYRTTFRPAPGLSGEHLILLLGKIDDIDEALLNGERIGVTGQMKKQGKPDVRRDEYKRLGPTPFLRER